MHGKISLTETCCFHLTFFSSVNSRVVIGTTGISSFIVAKRYIDRKRLELIKAKQKERMLEAQSNVK